jgi:hypothetical protein
MIVPTSNGELSYRWLIVRVGEKLFHVEARTDPYHFSYRGEQWKEEVDKLLIREMEHMLTKLFEKAAAETPDGSVLL